MEDEVTSSSELSTDSLEDWNTRLYVSRINSHEKDKKCLERSKRESSDEVLIDKGNLGNKIKVENVKTPEEKAITVSRSEVNSHLNNDNKRTVSSKGSVIYYNSSSHFFNDAPRSQSARIQSIRRVSRRQSVYFEAPESQKIRHRSVSYLEQFKKRHDGTNGNSLTATVTMLPSELTSLSCVSGTTITSVNKTDTSTEFEFHEDIRTNEDSNGFNSILREENKDNYKTIPVDRKGMSNQKKEQSRIQEIKQPNSDLRNCVQNHFDKRKALEKREEYSKKVQLRNQIKANRRKEKEKAIKFNGSLFNSHTYEQEYLHRSQDQTTLPLDSKDIDDVPFLINQLDLSATTRSDPRNRKTLIKPAKTKTKTKIQKSNTTEVCKLSMLQKRHESEKTVVDSIRNNFINR